jgi:RNA polymerase sigma factor (sigma-70 family)
MSAEDVLVEVVETAPDLHGPSIEDGDWLEKLVKFVGPKVAKRLRFSYPMLNQQDIEDILSTAALRAWQHRETFDPGKGSLNAWYFRIVVNFAISYIHEKINRIETSLEFVAHDLHCIVNQDQDYDVHSNKNRYFADIMGCINCLSDEDKIIMIKYSEQVVLDANGKNTAAWTNELADELDISPNTLRVRVFRIKERLRCLMSNRGHSID